MSASTSAASVARSASPSPRSSRKTDHIVYRMVSLISFASLPLFSTMTSVSQVRQQASHRLACRRDHGGDPDSPVGGAAHLQTTHGGDGTVDRGDAVQVPHLVLRQPAAPPLDVP